MELKIEYIDIGKIKPYENNPRHNEEAIPYVMNSIKEFGFKVPIILDKNNVIIAGHTRLESAKRLGMKEVPCLYANDLSEEQIKQFRLVDNKVSEKAEWNFELLQEELEDLDINMEDFGFDIDSEIEKEFERKDLSDKEFEKYEIIIKCQNESDLEEKYKKLTEEGYECQISTL